MQLIPFRRTSASGSTAGFRKKSRSGGDITDEDAFALLTDDIEDFEEISLLYVLQNISKDWMNRSMGI